jgi:hypothetical protein
MDYDILVRQKRKETTNGHKLNTHGHKCISQFVLFVKHLSYLWIKL